MTSRVVCPEVGSATAVSFFRAPSLLALLALPLAVTACGDDDEDPPPSGGAARVRVAHLSPDAPAVDFCLAAAGSGKFTTPVLAGAGAAAGLSYGKVTAYLDVPAGRYDVRLVGPGSSTCDQALGGLPDLTGLPELTEDGTFTLAATGKLAGGAAPFALRAYVDDPRAPAGSARLRFVHASPGTPAVDVGVGGGVAFTPVFRGVAFGDTAAGDLGYVTTPALDAVEISARATGTTADVLSIKPASLPAGAVATAFAIGELGSTATPLRVLLCVDSAAPSGLESACSVVGAAPERAQLRIAHLSPDAPAVDVCLAKSGSTAFTGPLLRSLGANAGLSYPQVTEYIALPVASYDVRIVLAGATSCDTAAVPDTRGVAVSNGLFATVAAIGVLDRSGPAANDPAFRLAVFADATSAGAGKAKLRFVHASPGTPAVDVGVLQGNAFTSLFGNVAFSKVAVQTGVDAQGYLEVNPLTATIAARPAGSNVNALVLPNVTLPANAVVTAFAIGGKTGATTNPLRALLCTDTPRSSNLLATCTVAP